MDEGNGIAGAVGDFFERARALLFDGAGQAPAQTQGGSLADSLYQLARGDIEGAKARAVAKLRSTKQWQDLEREAERQRIREIATHPLTLLIGLVLLWAWLRK